MGALWAFDTIVRQATRELDTVLAGTRTRDLDAVLFAADVLPEKMMLRDVGKYQAIEFMSRGPGTYWATADLVDQDGSGHLEITVSRTSARPPIGTDDLARAGSCSEHHLPDGVVLRSQTVRSNTQPVAGLGAFALNRVIAIRPDGTYVEALSSNQDSLNGRVTRRDPPFNIDRLTAIATLRDLAP